MKGGVPMTPGRIVYGAAFTGFGVLCLSYVDFVSALQAVQASMPAYRTLAVLTGVVLLASGLAIALDVAGGLAARVLIAVLASWIILIDVPAAFLQPELLRSPWWIRTFETVALAGAAIILAARVDGAASEAWARRGRVAVGLALPVFGVLHLVYPASVASLVPPWYPWPMFWAYFTGAAQIAAGAAIVAGTRSHLAATLAGVMYGAWALTLHLPRNWCRVLGPCETLPGVEVVGLQGSRAELTSLFVAVGMCGATWIVAAHQDPEEHNP